MKNIIILEIIFWSQEFVFYKGRNQSRILSNLMPSEKQTNFILPLKKCLEREKRSQKESTMYKHFLRISFQGHNLYICICDFCRWRLEGCCGIVSMHSCILIKHFLKPTDRQRMGLMATPEDISYANRLNFTKRTMNIWPDQTVCVS